MKNIIIIPLAFFMLHSPKLFSQDAAVKAYNNYDFVPGEIVVFDDDFSSAQDGEFPPRYDLINGQGVVNVMNKEKVFVFTDASTGNMGRITPFITKNNKRDYNYLNESFTVEADFMVPEDETFALYFKDNAEDEGRFISVEGNGIIKENYFDLGLQANYPNEEMLFGKWHHFAMAYKNGQMKIYINQHRVLVIPNCKFQPVALLFGGSLNVAFKNVKIALGGGMNMLDKIATEGKFITHAIKFESAKADLKPESMGFINELAKWLKANPAVKLEIGGHTDSDGSDGDNLALSELRATRVKQQLKLSGIDESRLTVKGYGETKPISDNTTSEGKANNRRVEFTKL
ncbi:MAG: hypothetical protein POELPBGB_01137 [Bacteroidia bacterium]|nr:hypothetical protein [Bacteroidia bacterium]